MHAECSLSASISPPPGTGECVPGRADRADNGSARRSAPRCGYKREWGLDMVRSSNSSSIL
jgi:hypothetical protein